MDPYLPGQLDNLDQKKIRGYRLVKLAIFYRQVQKLDRINSDRQSGSDQFGSTRIDSDRLGSRQNIKLNEILKLLTI